MKVKEGGTHGPARIGYKNVGEGSRRWIEVDPMTAPLITWAFMTYATGEWSVKSVLEEATERGLLSRGGPNTPRKPLTISQMHRVLSNPYYKGVVVFNGVQYEGKHEPIVYEDTWQKVQDILSSKARGEKQREHHHYLKGTIYCGHCGSRLVVSYLKGRTGNIYPYYFCVGRQQKRTTCMMKYRPIALVEEQIEEHYSRLEFKSEGLEAAAWGVLAEMKAEQHDTAQLYDRYRLRLKSLDAERQRLMQAHYAEAVPLDLLKSEQQRITDEMVYLQSALAASTATGDQLEATVRQATALARNCYGSYLQAGPRERRLMNQAFFKKVWVKEDGVVAWEFNEPFATLLRAHKVPEPVVVEEYETDELDDEYEADREPGAYYRRSPGRWTGASICVVSKANNLAEGVGFEPTVPREEHNGFRDRPIRPLSHPSGARG
jgi:site-specific DNA recombinase